MVSALISILVLGVLVIVHEAGHLLVARWTGVRILRFSVGFGPRLLTFKRGHTEYAISAIPLGGYVKMSGEQHTEHHVPKPWDYLAKPPGTRAAIIVAGPLVNYLVAFLSLWTVYVIGYPELLPVVGKVLDDMPAQAAGLQPGDRVRAINGRPIHTWEDLTKTVYGSPGSPLTLRVERGRTARTVNVTPTSKEMTDPFGRAKTVGLIGVAPSGEFEPYRLEPVQALGRAFRQQVQWTEETLVAMGSLLTGKLALRDSVTGPIGLVYLTSDAVKLGIAPVLFLASLFSLSLGIFNLFPIPILDGGHLFFLAIEQLRGKAVSMKVQERAAQVSFVLLMTLVLVISFNDLHRFGLLKWVGELFGGE
jgi:regulator of sigma E protease